MAVFTRINGSAAGVVNVDAGRSLANAAIVNTGIAAPLIAYKVTVAALGGTSGTGNLAAELGVAGGAVETVLRYVTANATVLAYQVDAGASGAQQISILAERSGWETATPGAGATAMQTVLQTLGNIGAVGNVWMGNATVASTGGLKLA